jgi:signal transduction histidine kinase
VRIAVAEDLAPLEAGLRKWHLLYGLLTLAVVLLVLLVQRRVVRRSLAPLDALQAQLRELECGERTQLDVAMPDEIAPLVAQLNDMLSIVLRRSRRSREALGNLAHALKTRLAVLVQASESPELAAHPELRQRLIDSSELMRHAIERELRRARLMGGAHPAQRSSARAAVDQLGRTLSILYAGKTPDIRIDIAPALTLAMDPEDLLELLGNLLDNACAWCAGVVSVSITRASDIRHRSRTTVRAASGISSRRWPSAAFAPTNHTRSRPGSVHRARSRRQLWRHARIRSFDHAGRTARHRASAGKPGAACPEQPRSPT